MNWQQREGDCRGLRLPRLVDGSVGTSDFVLFTKAYAEYNEKRMGTAIGDGVERSVAQAREFPGCSNLNLVVSHCSLGKKEHELSDGVNNGLGKVGWTSK